MYFPFCPFQNPIKFHDDIFNILEYIYTEGGGMEVVK